MGKPRLRIVQWWFYGNFDGVQTEVYTWCSRHRLHLANTEANQALQLEVIIIQPYGDTYHVRFMILILYIKETYCGTPGMCLEEDVPVGYGHGIPCQIYWEYPKVALLQTDCIQRKLFGETNVVSAKKLPDVCFIRSYESCSSFIIVTNMLLEHRLEVAKTVQSTTVRTLPQCKL